MDHEDIRQRFAALTTAHLADACIRAQTPVRCAPALLHAVVPGSRLAGRVIPARHAGSVDIFLEALQEAAPGDVLVVDNAGRLDESCVGDLVVLEAHAAGLDGIVIWGLHRDTSDIRAIGLPVISLGAIPTGPQRLDLRPDGALERATVGDWTVDREIWSWPMTMGCFSFHWLPQRMSSRSQTRSATLKGVKPNSCAEESPCATRFSLILTLLSAKKHLP